MHSVISLPLTASHQIVQEFAGTCVIFSRNSVYRGLDAAGNNTYLAVALVLRFFVFNIRFFNSLVLVAKCMNNKTIIGFGFNRIIHTLISAELYVISCIALFYNRYYCNTYSRSIFACDWSKRFE